MQYNSIVYCKKSLTVYGLNSFFRRFSGHNLDLLHRGVISFSVYPFYLYP